LPYLLDKKISVIKELWHQKKLNSNDAKESLQMPFEMFFSAPWSIVARLLGFAPLFIVNLQGWI
jgi:hypothetical protein